MGGLEWFDALRPALGLQRLRQGLLDPSLVPLTLAGGLGLWIGPGSGFALWPLLFGAFAEELVFRAVLQGELEKRFGGQGVCGLTRANLVVSVLFALAHAATQPFTQAVTVVVPSLAFGLLWTRTRSLWLCVFLHVVYNIFYFL